MSDSDISTYPSISIVGAGALGNSLRHALVEKSYSVTVFQRGEIASKLDVPLGKLVLISVNDDSVSKVVNELIKHRSEELRTSFFIHCSGSLPLNILNELKNPSLGIGVIHPIQTFVKSTISSFKDVFVSVVTENAQLNILLTTMLSVLGAKSQKVTEPEKLALHIAAVFASNFIVGNLHAAQRVLDNQKLNVSAKDIFRPLYEQAITNITQQSLEEALSGPVKRGDISTIENHKELLGTASELGSMYSILTNNLFNLLKRNR